LTAFGDALAGRELNRLQIRINAVVAQQDLVDGKKWQSIIFS
jgi:hypothetical protein